jgi:hypothetical protein
MASSSRYEWLIRRNAPVQNAIITPFSQPAGWQHDNFRKPIVRFDCLLQFLREQSVAAVRDHHGFAFGRPAALADSVHQFLQSLLPALCVGEQGDVPVSVRTEDRADVERGDEFPRDPAEPSVFQKGIDIVQYEKRFHFGYKPFDLRDDFRFREPRAYEAAKLDNQQRFACGRAF